MYGELVIGCSLLPASCLQFCVHDCWEHLHYPGIYDFISRCLIRDNGLIRKAMCCKHTLPDKAQIFFVTSRANRVNYHRERDSASHHQNGRAVRTETQERRVRNYCCSLFTHHKQLWITMAKHISYLPWLMMPPHLFSRKRTPQRNNMISEAIILMAIQAYYTLRDWAAMENNMRRRRHYHKVYRAVEGHTRCNSSPLESLSLPITLILSLI